MNIEAGFIVDKRGEKAEIKKRNKMILILVRAAKNDGEERAGGMKRKKQTRVLTHPDKMEQGVSLGTSHTHANILHHQYTLYMRACLKDQAPGSEHLL